MAGMASCQKVPKFDFQSQFSMSKITWIFLNFFINKYQFRSTYCYSHFFIFFFSLIFLFIKSYPILVSLPLIQNSKFNNFLWVCWFLWKSLSNILPPAWKLHNPYCHTRAATCKIRAILAACPAHHIYEDNDHGTNEAMTKHIIRIYFVRNTNFNQIKS